MRSPCQHSHLHNGLGELQTHATAPKTIENIMRPHAVIFDGNLDLTPEIFNLHTWYIIKG